MPLLIKAAQAVSLSYNPPRKGGTGYDGIQVQLFGVHMNFCWHNVSLLIAVWVPHLPLAVKETILAGFTGTTKKMDRNKAAKSWRGSLIAAMGSLPKRSRSLIPLVAIPTDHQRHLHVLGHSPGYHGLYGRSGSSSSSKISTTLEPKKISTWHFWELGGMVDFCIINGLGW